jgi:hypothetical protein
MLRNHKQALAAQAWESLVAAIESAGDTTRHAKRRAASYVDDASDRIGSRASEARRRANRARDALVGKPAPTPWGMLAMVAALAAAGGWLAAGLIKRNSVVTRHELAEFADDLPVDLTAARR